MGIGLYGLTYLYPVYLAQVRGYDALMIGETMFVTGVAMFLTAPIAGRLSQSVDPRFLMLTGFLGFALGTYIASGITSNWDFKELLIPQILRGCSLMLCMVPINNLSLGTLAPEELKNASGLFNLNRNLGGAVGLALINTLLNKRLDLHLARLHEQVAWGHARAEETLAGLAERLANTADAELAAVKQLARMVRVQAEVLSFADVFLALSILFASLALFAPLMSKPAADGKARPHTDGARATTVNEFEIAFRSHQYRELHFSSSAEFALTMNLRSTIGLPEYEICNCGRQKTLAILCGRWVIGSELDEAIRRGTSRARFAA